MNRKTEVVREFRSGNVSAQVVVTRTMRGGYYDCRLTKEYQDPVTGLIRPSSLYAADDLTAAIEVAEKARDFIREQLSNAKTVVIEGR